jgi:hypothetical protein
MSDDQLLDHFQQTAVTMRWDIECQAQIHLTFVEMHQLREDFARLTAESNPSPAEQVFMAATYIELAKLAEQFHAFLQILVEEATRPVPIALGE